MINEKRKEISKTVGITLEFTILVMLGGMLIPKIDGADNNWRSIIICVIATVLVYLQSRKYLPEGWPVRNGSRCSLWSFLLVLGIVSFWQFITGIATSGSSAVPDEGWIYVIYMGLLIPICEELVFRGFVMTRLKKYGAVFAILGSSFLFGIYHCNVVQLITGTLLGIVFGYFAMNYSVIYTILLHIINNGLYVLILPKISTAFEIPYLKIIVGACLTILGIIAFFKVKPVNKIKEFIKENRTEKGTYKYLFLNVWFLLIIAGLAAGTAIIFITALSS